MRHKEHHRSNRTGWLRAAVLGANDGTVSTASLILGVATSHASHSSIVVAGIAALVAGAMSMAAGEYVSVSSQKDTEEADLAIETKGLQSDPRGEKEELAEIYVERGLDRTLATEVAKQLMARDALRAHARDELGITDELSARPLQAAWASAGSFTIGALVPLSLAALIEGELLPYFVAGLSLLFLAVAGGADSDEAGHAFQSEAGHLFRREAGRDSDLKPATKGRSLGHG
jgi:VIT1/CCC1 family predicted Fe2+/Mn2+ transporter